MYKEYLVYKKKCETAQKIYDNIVSEKEELFISTQPKAVTYDKEKVAGGTPSNVFDDYLIQQEFKQLDERLNIARSILEDRIRLLKLKEEQLRHSNNPYDKAYVSKYLDRKQVYKVAKEIDYSEPQTYRILRIIRKDIKLIENDSFDCDIIYNVKM
jgi:hypothetical protein